MPVFQVISILKANNIFDFIELLINVQLTYFQLNFVSPNHILKKSQQLLNQFFLVKFMLTHSSSVCTSKHANTTHCVQSVRRPVRHSMTSVPRQVPQDIHTFLISRN